MDTRPFNRFSRALLTAMSSGVARGVALLSTLVFAPVVFRYLGPQRFGIWATLTSIVTLAGFTDLGLGNGLIMAVSAAHGRDDADAIRKAIATTFFLLGAVAIALGLGFLVAYWTVPWAALFNAPGGAAATETAASVAALAVCFLAGLPFSIAEKAQLGVQRGYLAGAWLAGGSVGGLMIAVAAVALHAGLPVFVAATVGAPVLAAISNCVFWFVWRCPAYRPRIRYVDFRIAGTLVRLGGLFLALDVSVAVAYMSDPLVANQVLGPDAAAQYWLAMKVFSAIPVVASLMTVALWPAYGEAVATGDVAWVRSALRRTLVVGAIASVSLATVLALIGPGLLRLWSGPGAHPDQSLLIALAIWSALLVCGSAVSSFLTGIGVIRLQVVASLVMAATNLPLSIILAHRIGLSGVVWATIATYILFIGLPYVLLVPRTLARLAHA